MTEFYQVTDLMKEDEFWQLIEESLKVAQAEHEEIGDEQQEVQHEFLKSKLMELSWQDIVKFRNRFDDLHMLSYKDDLWCAGYILNGGCSDDGFDYFRAWLISQGKETFYNALKNPDSLADLPQVTNDVEYYEFEDIIYVAGDAFTEKYKDDIYDYLGDKPSQGKFEMTWEFDDEDSMRKLCPKLMGKFWDEE